MKKYLIASVVALTVALVGVSASASFDRNLSVGSTGADVSALQTWLISKGFSIPSIASGAATPGYFGQQTKSAVIAYQASVSLPTTGFVGPLTRGILNGGAASTPVAFTCPVGFTCTANPGTVVPVTMSGATGEIADVNVLSQYNNEEVGDGQSDVKVAGFEVKASNDGDIAINSMKLTFSGASSSGSKKITDYAQSVSIWMGSTKIGTASLSDFNKDSTGVYSRTVALTKSVVKSDTTEKFYITLNSVSNLDSGDITGDAWSVQVNNIRYEDGSGVVTTEISTGDLPISVGINFVNFATASNTELKLSTDSANPIAGGAMVSETADTNGVTLLVGKMRLDGTSDVTLNELPITLTSSISSSSLAAIANSVTLKIAGEEFTKSVSTTTNNTDTIVFDNLDVVLKAGQTTTFTVTADINDINPTTAKSSDFDQGYTLKADLTSTNRAAIDAENKQGDQLASGEKTGTVTGNYQEFRTKGIALTFISATADATTGTSANDDVGQFTIKFSARAFGDTVYMGSTTANYTFALDKGGVSTSTALTSASVVNNTDTTLSAVGDYVIEDGSAEEFTLSVSVPMAAGLLTSGQYRVSLTGVKWDTTDTASLSNTYTSKLDAFKTPYKVLN